VLYGHRAAAALDRPLVNSQTTTLFTHTVKFVAPNNFPAKMNKNVLLQFYFTSKPCPQNFNSHPRLELRLLSKHKKIENDFDNWKQTHSLHIADKRKLSKRSENAATLYRCGQDSLLVHTVQKRFKSVEMRYIEYHTQPPVAYLRKGMVAQPLRPHPL